MGWGFQRLGVEGDMAVGGDSGMEGDGDTDRLGLFPASVPSQNTLEARKFPPPLTLVLTNAKSINNKILMLQAIITVENVDLAYVTETRMREGELLTFFGSVVGERQHGNGFPAHSTWHCASSIGTNLQEPQCDLGCLII